MPTDYQRSQAGRASRRGDGQRPRFSPPARGATVIELLVVTFIILAVTAIAIPSIINVVASAKLRGGMGDLSGLMQNCRMQAVKQNRTKFLQFAVSGDRVVAYIDDAANPQGLTSDPPPQRVQLPREFARASAAGGSCSALNATSMWGGGSDPVGGLDRAYFNPMGTPCNYSSGACAAGTGFIYYFTYKSASDTRWTALGVSPAGRIKSWYCNGSTWGD